MIKITKVDSDTGEGMRFDVDSAVRGDYMNTVPVHPTESGFSVTDHITHEMDKATVNIVLGVIGGDAKIDTSGRESTQVDSTGASYKFLKELHDNGTIVKVNLNYHDLQIFHEMVIQSLSAAVGERILTCTVVFSEIRRATLETKQIDVVQDKDGSILYYPEGAPSATETMASGSTLLPGDASTYLNELVAASEITPLPNTDPNAATISFSGKLMVVTKRYSVNFLTGQYKSVTFKFTTNVRDDIFLSVSWDGVCTQKKSLSGFVATMWDVITGEYTYGTGECNGFSGKITKSESCKVTHPDTGELLFTVFIRDIEHTTSGFPIKRMYLTSTVWIYDLYSG